MNSGCSHNGGHTTAQLGDDGRGGVAAACAQSSRTDVNPRRLVYKTFACCLDDGEPVDVTVAYDSDDIDEVVGPDGGKRSGRMRRRRSSCRNSLSSYRSVNNKDQQPDPSLRCISVGSATQAFVDLSLCFSFVVYLSVGLSFCHCLPGSFDHVAC